MMPDTLFDASWSDRVLASASAACVAALDRTSRNEGGFSNRAEDRGGATNCGITLATARLYGFAFDYDGDGIVSVRDLLKITPRIASAFFFEFYVRRPGIINLPDKVIPVAVDMSVNMGPVRSILLVQSAAAINGATVTLDGSVGPQTRDACRQIALRGASALVSLVNTICTKRSSFYRAIVASDATQAANLKGWLRRSDSYRVTS